MIRENTVAPKAQTVWARFSLCYWFACVCVALLPTRRWMFFFFFFAGLCHPTPPWRQDMMSRQEWRWELDRAAYISSDPSLSSICVLENKLDVKERRENATVRVCAGWNVEVCCHKHSNEGQTKLNEARICVLYSTHSRLVIRPQRLRLPYGPQQNRIRPAAGVRRVTNTLPIKLSLFFPLVWSCHRAPNLFHADHTSWPGHSWCCGETYALAKLCASYKLIHISLIFSCRLPQYKVYHSFLPIIHVMVNIWARKITWSTESDYVSLN